MLEALQLPFFQRALAAGALASVAAGIIGSFVLVKRMVSVAGGLSHAAFGGVGLGYLLGFNPLAGALGFGLLSGVGVGMAQRRLRTGLDTIISMVWSVGMALGMLFVALSPGYAPDLTSYLFGSLLFVPRELVYLMGGADAIILVVTVFLFKDLRAVAFDEEFAEVVGEPVERLFLTLMALVSLAVVVLIRVVGVILVIALLSLPAAIARQWSEDLKKMMVLATMVAVGCTTSGLFASYWLSESFGVSAPTGPVIVLVATGLYLLSSGGWRLRRRAAVLEAGAS